MLVVRYSHENTSIYRKKNKRTESTTKQIKNYAIKRHWFREFFSCRFLFLFLIFVLCFHSPSVLAFFMTLKLVLMLGFFINSCCSTKTWLPRFYLTKQQANLKEEITTCCLYMFVILLWVWSFCLCFERAMFRTGEWLLNEYARTFVGPFKCTLSKRCCAVMTVLNWSTAPNNANT